MAAQETWNDVRPRRQRWLNGQCTNEFGYWGVGHATRDRYTQGGCGSETWYATRSGNAVVLIQQALNAARNYVAGLWRNGAPAFPNPPARLVTDGIFGSKSERVTKYVQLGLNLSNPPDGIIGPITWGRLNDFV